MTLREGCGVVGAVSGDSSGARVGGTITLGSQCHTGANLRPCWLTPSEKAVENEAAAAESPKCRAVWTCGGADDRGGQDRDPETASSRRASPARRPRPVSAAAAGRDRQRLVKRLPLTVGSLAV